MGSAAGCPVPAGPPGPRRRAASPRWMGLRNALLVTRNPTADPGPHRRVTVIAESRSPVVPGTEAFPRGQRRQQGPTERSPTGHPARKEGLHWLLGHRASVGGSTDGGRRAEGGAGRQAPCAHGRSLFRPVGSACAVAARGSRGCRRLASVLSRFIPSCTQGSSWCRARSCSPWLLHPGSPVAECPREAYAQAPDLSVKIA